MVYLLRVNKMHVHLLIPAFLSPCCVANCPEGMFFCPTENICIDGGLRCDGIPDCASGADEQSCEGRYMKFELTVIL